MSRLGHHYIAEIWDCPPDILDDSARLESLARAAAEAAQVTVLNSHFHQFHPQGVTGLLLLSESHLSVHTWPEHGYCAMDLFTCGNAAAAREAILELASRMESGRLELQIVGRGHLTPVDEPEPERWTLYPPFQWTTATAQEELPLLQAIARK